jgi:hypothetical protein
MHYGKGTFFSGWIIAPSKRFKDQSTISKKE